MTDLDRLAEGFDQGRVELALPAELPGVRILRATGSTHLWRVLSDVYAISTPPSSAAEFRYRRGGHSFSSETASSRTCVARCLVLPGASSSMRYSLTRTSRGSQDARQVFGRDAAQLQIAVAVDLLSLERVVQTLA